jgi:hypothetical protein
VSPVALRDRLRRLQEAMRGTMDCIELEGGERFWFEPAEAHKELFLYFADSMRAVYHETPRPEPPEVLKAVAGAKDREGAYRRVYPQGIVPWCPLDVDALLERGEFVPRSLVAGRDVDEPVPDLSEP